MAEITTKGYQLKTQNEWFAEEFSLYKAIDPEWDLDPSSPDGLKTAHDAEIFSALDEGLLRAYNSKDPEKAQGIELDIISAFAGIIRKKGTRSDVTIRFFGNVGANVLVGATVESVTTGTRWTTEQVYTIQPSGYVDATAFATDVGPIAAESNSLTKLITVMTGITSCTNLDPANLGLDKENDSALRIRRRRAVGKPANNMVDAMYSAIVEAKDVRRVAIYNNPTGTNAVSDLNPHGLPAHSISVIVDGGADEDVAAAMYSKLSPGVGMNQAATPVSVPVTSPVRPSNVQIVKFSRPDYVDVELEIEISGSDLPDGIEDQVKDAIMEYAMGSLLDPSVGFRSSGFDIGDIVPYSSIFTPINKIIGQYGNAYVVSMTLNGATTNLPIAFNQLSRWSLENISVTKV